MASDRRQLRMLRLMRVKPICNLVFWLRFVYYFRIKGALRTHSDELGSDDIGRKHNLRGITDGKPSDRILKLILPLSVIDVLDEDSKILAIGARYETDLLYLSAYGFRPENIRGLDLYSYSPWIDLGNMHTMPYADDSWNAVLMGWVLTYSTNPKLAAKEAIRVAKPGGVIAIGITVSPAEQINELEKQGRIIGTSAEILSTQDILDLFGTHVKTVYFRHDRNDPSKQGHSLVVFSINK